ncbi:MAG: PQQ-dependent sugar dehydrogenase, partial [Methanomicrobiales archaeon]|nr:PQQ-dependent sugar dehydrogenase [Methanomicrobiales archaeon]
MVVLAMMSVLFAGCTAPPAAVPAITISSPADGATLPAGNVTVTVSVTGLTIVDKLGGANVAGEGHIHYFLDATPPTEQGKPAVTAPGTYAATTATSYTWRNVTSGTHTLGVELVQNDHTPLATPVWKLITVTVVSQGPGITITAPADGAVLPSGDIAVSVVVQNFRINTSLGTPDIAGEGHIHYFLDVDPPTQQGKPAVTAPGTYAATADTTYTWRNISSGSHRLSVELVRNDHTPLATPVTASVQVTVGSAPIDLTNRNSPQAATFTLYPSRTRLTTPQQSLGLQYVAGGFISPMMIVPAVDGSRKTYVVEQSGVVQILTPERTLMTEPFLDVRNKLVPLIGAYDERGLFSMAFHPDYKNNGRLFVYYSAPLRTGAPSDWNCTNILAEYHVTPGNPDKVDMSSEKIILMVDKPYMNHNGGFLLFGPDGYLYLPLGDGGRADDTGIGHTPGIGNAQDLTKILGKVIRIDINNPPSGKTYGIPADNPFVNTPGALPEIYAYGFRNPAYAGFDSGDGRHLFVWMAGQRLFESAFVVLKGGDYGWNVREGTHCFDPNNDALVPNTTCAIAGYRGEPLIGPVVELGHDLGNTIIGGTVYRGS